MVPKTLTLYAESSSSDEIYEVVCKIQGNLVSIKCSCPGGMNVNFCKHLKGLLNGKVELGTGEAVGGSPAEITGDVRNHEPLQRAIRQLNEALQSVDQKRKELTKEGTAAKKTFARRLQEGI